MPCVQALSAFAFALALAAPNPASGAHGFLRKSDEVTTAEAQSSLLDELTGNVSSGRLQELEEALRPMYSALPKGENGYMGHQAVRYALHRLLLQRHGWFIVGLEPSDEARPPYLAGGWVPEYLQGLLEQRLGGRGLDLREIAALAAALEDLVHAEAARRMDLVYGALGKPVDERLGNAEADRVLETYMMLYLDEVNFNNLSFATLDVDKELALFKKEYADWDSAASWMQQIKGHHLSNTSDGKLGHDSVVGIANELGERFGTFNDGECKSLKKELLNLEGSRPGRVPLLDFYKKGLYSHWRFNERVEYLRALGAVDESDANYPSVILSNYLGSKTNCLAASGLYAVCCRNECEDLMAHLEHEIAAPAAAPERILTLVSSLPSDTVSAPREVPAALTSRLHEIAARHGGEVPLHGRLFAQWMHHAYPRECPYPHEGANPQTPDEWMKEASEAELRELLGSCAAEGAGPCSAAPETSNGPLAELPWSEAEVLLDAPVDKQGRSAGSLALLALPVLLALLSLRVSGRSPSQALDDEPEKPDLVEQHRKQQAKVLLALVVAGILLDLLGVLDCSTLLCALCFGMVFNMALPFLVRRRAVGLKAAKCVV